MGQPFSAMNLYKQFVVPHPVYGLKLLKEMLHCSVVSNFDYYYYYRIYIFCAILFNHIL